MAILKIVVINNCSAFGSSYFCFSFFIEKKSERIERKLKTQNPNLSMASPVRSSSVRNASRLHIKKANYFKLS